MRDMHICNKTNIFNYSTVFCKNQIRHSWCLYHRQYAAGCKLDFLISSIFLIKSTLPSLHVSVLLVNVQLSYNGNSFLAICERCKRLLHFKNYILDFLIKIVLYERRHVILNLGCLSNFTILLFIRVSRTIYDARNSEVYRWR